MSFTEYVSYYGLIRSESTVLRYLTDAYRALRSSIPAAARTEAVEDLASWLGELVRQIDSSLLDEWEQLTSPDTDPTAPVEVKPVERTLTANTRAFTVLVRNALFRRVELAAHRRYHDLGALDAHSGWDTDAWQDALEDYFADYDTIGIGPNARNPALLHINQQPDLWLVRQVFDDPDSDHDWGINAEVDLAASDTAGEPVIRVTAVGPLT
jgi:hypothetical protein